MVRVKFLLSIISSVLILFAACNNTGDAATTTKVKQRLAADSEISALKVDVDTKGGVVTLTGEVDSQRAKDRAGELAAQVEGVKRVDNRLQVNPAAARAGEGKETTNGTERDKQTAQEGDRDRTTTLDDATILTKIKAKLLAEGIIGTDVDVKNGVVSLKGEVSSAAERDKAARLATETEGVKSVNNQLKVKKS